jgi:hypothetical protein
LLFFAILAIMPARLAIHFTRARTGEKIPGTCDLRGQRRADHHLGAKVVLINIKVPYLTQGGRFIPGYHLPLSS